MAAVATSRPAIDPIAGIVKVVESPNLKIQIARALPKNMDLDRFMRICMTNIRNRYDLQKCEPLSLVSSIVEASQLGLELDPILGHGYLVPFRRKDGKFICTFIPGYRGFIHLMRNSGLVHLVNAELIVVGDEHDEMLGTQRHLHHKPIFGEVDRLLEKNWIGAYATVTWTSNGQPDYEYMHREAINDIRKRSPAERAGKKGPWVTDTAEMWKKTPTRRIAKRMPLSPQTRELIKAATRDEYRENEEYRNKEPMAAVLDDIDVRPVGQIEVSTENPEPPAATQPAGESRRTGKPMKSDKKAKASAESGTSKDEKLPPVKFISAGRQEAFRCLAMEERNMTKEEYINFLGSMGYEKPEQIEESKWLKVWEALSREKRYR